MANLKSVSPQQAVALVRSGAVLVDVRETHEFTTEHIPGARHHALSRLDARLPLRGDEIVIFHCLSGARTRSHGARLAAAAGCEAYVLEGGLAAWKRAGLPTAAGTR
jgi:rhodanese-related sulfurtransferase